MKEQPLEVWLDRWRSACRWRRRVEAELRHLELTLAQWRVLDALATLLRETRDAVSQLEVAQRLEMDKATTSQVLRGLERRGLVDIGPAFGGPANRIILTKRGKSAAAQGHTVVESVSAGECAPSW